MSYSLMFGLLLDLLLLALSASDPPPPTSRIDCFPDNWALSQENCGRRGCVYDTNTGGRQGVPWCYMPPQTIGHRVESSCSNCNGKLLRIELAPLSNSVVFDPPIQHVLFTATILNDYHLQFKIEDRDYKRFEVPFNPPTFKPSTTSTADSATFKVEYTQNPFTFKVIRKSTGAALFDTGMGGFVFSNRFLQITTRLASRNLYGLGEHEHPSLKHDLEYKVWPMFDRDQPGLGETLPLYGTHPMYMVLEDDGNAHGVFLMNSNAMEFAVIPAPGVIVRTIGGIFDFHIYSGPTPENVVQEHTEFVGRPYLPPYWSLGFNLARWGYNKLENMKAAIERTRKYGIPLDVVYADIDHMDKMRDFTLDTANFADLPSYLASERDNNGLRSVIILDPAVTNNATNYDAWNVLSGNNTFVKWQNGTVMIGYVWPPGKVAFPDFFLNSTAEVWKDLIVRHSKVIPFDGLWIDMNEPSNFGTNEDQPWNWPIGEPAWSLKCPKSDYEDPPYRTYAISRYDQYGKPARLSDKTLCMEAVQSNGIYKNYDVHNLYGFSESKPTIQGLQAAYPGRRGFVLSRSTFAGSGHYVSHWLGDNKASWTHLRRSIIGMLEMSLFGIPHTGPDICGFLDEPTPELCKRWMQLGAFYPYSRNHNGLATKDQDPGVFGPEVAEPSRFWMRVRYNLLPYMYTLFYKAHVNGTTVARPLFHEFPTDRNTWSIDRQFMLGSALMVVPVLEPGSSTPITAYMPPKSKWLNHVTHGKPIDNCNKDAGQYATFANNYDITLFQRGGSIVVYQGINTGNIISTKKTRLEPFSMNVVFDCENKASGTLFWDDGDSTDTIKFEKYWLISYRASYNETKLELSVTIDHKSVDEQLGAKLYYSAITLHGIPRAPHLHAIMCPTCTPIASSTSYNDDGKLVITLDSNQPTIGIAFDLLLSFV